MKRMLALSCLCLSLIASGCVSIPRGYQTGSRQVSTDRMTVVDSIGEVVCSPKVQNGKVVLTAYAPGKFTNKEVVTTATARRDKVMTIGFFPAFPAFRSVGEAGSYWRWTALATVLNLGVWAPVFNWPCQPFVSYRDPLHGLEPQNQHKNLHALAWFGAYKWLKPAHFETVTEERVIQSGIEKPLPLSRIQVECEIPAISYRDRALTDDRGQALFDLAVAPSRRTEVSFSLLDVSQNPYADRLRMEVGRKQSFELSFSGGSDARPLSATRSDLPRPSWTPEPVAVMSVAANNLPASEAAALTEWFHNSLAEPKYFKLVSRNDMSTILTEQRFQRSDNCDDTQCLVEVGKLLAVGRMIGGSIAKVGQLYVFTSRMVDVETGEVICSAKGSTSGDSEKLLAMIGEVAEELCVEYGKLKQRR